MEKTEQQKMKMKILRDALKVISKPNIKVKQRNGYLLLTLQRPYAPDAHKAMDWLESDGAFHTSLLKNSETVQCEVCALGSMLLADIDKTNGLSVRELTLDSSPVISRLRKYFTYSELRTIEGVFEQDPESPRETTLWRAAGGLRNRARLEAMLQFLIKNKGVVE